MTYLWQTHDSFSSFAFQICSEMACNRGQAYSPIPACLTFFPLLPPLLNIGIAFAILQSDGASPNSTELLKILVTRPAISCASSLQEQRGGRSHPKRRTDGRDGLSTWLPHQLCSWPCPRSYYPGFFMASIFVLTKSQGEISICAQIPQPSLHCALFPSAEVGNRLPLL